MTSPRRTCLRISVFGLASGPFGRLGGKRVICLGRAWKRELMGSNAVPGNESVDLRNDDRLFLGTLSIGRFSCFC